MKKREKDSQRARSRDRTDNLENTNHVLHQLSYSGGTGLN